MTQAPPKPRFGKGGAIAVAESDSQGGGKFAKTHYLTSELKKAGDKVTVRFVTDMVENPLTETMISIQMHQSIATKPKPDDATGNWPKSMSSVCRYAKFKDPESGQVVKVFEGIYDDCAICDLELPNERGEVKTPSVRGWAVACLREPVVLDDDLIFALDPEAHKDHSVMKLRGVLEYRLDPEHALKPPLLGKIVNYTDATREVEVVDKDGKATGEKRKELALVVVNMGVNNFFAAVQAIAEVKGTVCDRDLHVTRRGEGLKTTYDVVSEDASPSLYPGSPRWKKYEDALAEQKLSVETLVGERADDEYYARFFDPRVDAPSREKKDGQTASTSQQAPPASDTQDAETKARLDAVRNRMSAKPAAALPDID